jgi:hypothetical protein
MLKVLQFLIFAFPSLIHAQGMIVNEISNGTSGSGGGAQEYMEFVVIGSSENPSGSVNLSGWIIDDNNGEFEALGSGVGIAQGHLRIAPGCLSSVKPGSIILIYNDADRNPHIAAGSSDPTDSNSDCVYILRASDPCVQSCNLRPSTTSTSYTGCVYSTASWTFAGMANSGDVGQVRQPDGSFFHGFAYGDVIVPSSPSFPTSLGGGSAFSISGSGTSAVFLFNSGNFKTLSNFSRAITTTNSATTFETPGRPNNNANRYFLNSLRNGTYNYANLNALSNVGTSVGLDPCQTILDVNLKDFRAEKDGQYVALSWELEREDTEILSFEIQRSSSAEDFLTIATLESFNSELFFQFLDRNPMSENYYRIKITEASGEQSYSQIRNINFDNLTDLSIYPNPIKAGSILNIRLDAEISTVQLYNAIGQLVLNEKYPTENVEIPTHLATGIYTIVIDLVGSQIIRKLSVE